MELGGKIMKTYQQLANMAQSVSVDLEKYKLTNSEALVMLTIVCNAIAVQIKRAFDEEELNEFKKQA